MCAPQHYLRAVTFHGKHQREPPRLELNSLDPLGFEEPARVEFRCNVALWSCQQGLRNRLRRRNTSMANHLLRRST